MPAPAAPTDPLKATVWIDLRPTDYSKLSGYELTAEIFGADGYDGPFLITDAGAEDGVATLVPKVQAAKSNHSGRVSMELPANDIIVPGGSYYRFTQTDAEISQDLELEAGTSIDLALVVSGDLPAGGGYTPPRLFFTTSIVRAATTANITIATALNNGDTLDGLTLATGDRVLVKDQSAPAQNGVYVVGASPARSTDFDAWEEFPGATVDVTEGTANAGTLWRCTATSGGTLGTTAIEFDALAGSGGGSSTWGGITGTLSDQTDLQAALDAKLATNGNGSAVTNLNASNLATGTVATARMPGAVAMGSANVDWTSGQVFTKTLSGNTTFTFSNVTAGQTIQLLITGAGGWGYNLPALTWDGSSLSGVIGTGEVQRILLTALTTSDIRATRVGLTSGTDYLAPGGALGTPSSGTLTNTTGLPVSTGISGLGSGVATALATGVTEGGNGAGDSGKLAKYNSNGQLSVTNALFVRGSGGDSSIQLFDATDTYSIGLAAGPTANRNQSLPDADGTILLTDGNGSALTALNATQLTSGTLADARNTVSNSTTTTLSAVTSLTAGASMTVGPNAGTSGTVTLQTRSAGGATQTNLTLNADQSSTFSGAIIMTAGSSGATSLNNGEATHGFYWRNSHSFTYSNGGDINFQFNEGRLELSSSNTLGWSPSSPNAVGPDTGFCRISTGLIGVTLGAAGFGGSIKCTNAEFVGTLAVTGATTLSSRLNVASYTVGTLPAAGAAGGVIYVSDAAVAPCLAFSDGTNWKRCDNAATTVV